MIRMVMGLCLILGLVGCRTFAPQTVSQPIAPPKVTYLGQGRQQLSPEGWLFIQHRYRLSNDTGQTIWVSQSLWRKPADEPAPQPRLGDEPTIEPMRPLAHGHRVDFYQWALKQKPHRTRCWYRTSRRGPLIPIHGPTFKP